MDTITINITLPKQMKLAVDSQVKNGLYTSFSEFVRNAVRTLLSEEKKLFKNSKSLQKFFKP